MNPLNFTLVIAIPLFASPLVYLSGRLGARDLILKRRSYVVRGLALLAILAAWPVFRKLGATCAVFILINVVPPLLSGTSVSLARLTSTLFPLFLWLAITVRREHLPSLVGAFAVLQGLFATVFFTWRRFY